MKRLHKFPIRRLFLAGAAATLSSIVLVQIYFWLSKYLDEPYLIPVDAGTSAGLPLSWSMPALVTLAAGIVGTAILVLLLCISSKPVPAFLSVIAAALLLSLGGPLNLPSTSLQTRILLAGMHVVAAGSFTGALLIIARRMNLPL